ncbi:hypothetical protein [Microbacterium sp. Marseille-Q6648]|uniref:hypothetical protein n=1 Tax=Microbacterium sp. Marseille-Q6648 TaxID=2937991 RepID=UPI002040A9D4|nr:hypothetical protein [Microbacterium sp. Marseille-Q6648]
MIPRGARDNARRAAIWVGVGVLLALNAALAVGFGAVTGLLGFSGFPIVGAIILMTRPRNGVGRYLYAVGILWGVSAAMALAGGFADTGGWSGVAGVATGPAWAEAIQAALGWPAWVMLPLIGLIFPTGRVETRSGRALFWLLIGFAALAGAAEAVRPGPLPVSARPNPLGVPALTGLTDAVTGPVGLVCFLGIIVAVIVDLAVRWRRSSGADRLQYRWLVFGLVSTIAIVALSGAINAVFPGRAWVEIWSAIAVLSTNLIPVAIGIAVTRHGLYELGRVVSRTVSYAIVTALVIGIYAAAVTSTTRLLPDLPTVGVAVATLVAAALFLPALRMVQRRIDRRFDREHYDAQEVVDEFGERLRIGTDPLTTSDDLTRAVERTLQPTAIGLWTTGAGS